LVFAFQLPRQDSNLDKESQKVSPSRRNLRDESTFGNDTIPFDAGLRESPKSDASDADLRRVLDAWPTLPSAIRRGILALIKNGSSDAPGTPQKGEQ
jgi:hypothetical protein